MSSPDLSSGTPKRADLFEDLWRQLGECHQHALQELEAKVRKLKKERCLDAQRLELFYSRNQQLKEQNKTLEEAVGLLEERLRVGECDRCAILGENLKNNQEQNLCLIAKLKNEKNSLEDENRKLHTELQTLKMSRSGLQQASPPEQEEGVIPDSPVLPSSLPTANKLKKRRNVDKVKHVRYAEMPLPLCNNSLFSEVNKVPADAAKDPGRAEVLVPNTCELDASQLSSAWTPYPEEVIAETCGLELHKPLMKTATPAAQPSSSASSWKSDFSLKPRRVSASATLLHAPDSTTERSPSLLVPVKRLSEDGSVNSAKRRKERSEPEVPEEDKQGNQEGADRADQREGTRKQAELIKLTAAATSFKKEPQDIEIQSVHNGHNVSCLSPAFKKPNVRGETNKGSVGRRGNPPQDPNASRHQHQGGDGKKEIKAEPTWSIDPALAMSMYDSECGGDEQEEQQHCNGELADTDCTWVSHSLLQGRGENGHDRRESVSGLGKKANDSLDLMFDTSAYGEYESCHSPHLGQSRPRDDDDDDDDDEGGGEEDDEEDPHENTMNQSKENKAQRPAFAHVTVVRKKDERRKLKGSTCKECEIYYSHLPEEEKQKKLSACSRHRFLYIPPCTPENFWEVGFPSTQTCIERGYIREEKNPQFRSRRRQPFNALFSPKQNQQES